MPDTNFNEFNFPKIKKLSFRIITLQSLFLAFTVIYTFTIYVMVGIYTPMVKTAEDSFHLSPKVRSFKENLAIIVQPDGLYLPYQ